jgi:transposase-like protein
LSHPAFDGDFEARVCLAEGEVSGHGTCEEADEGRRKDVLTSQEREEIKSLRREVAQLRRANEILKAASVFFAGELDPHRPK